MVHDTSRVTVDLAQTRPRTKLEGTGPTRFLNRVPDALMKETVFASMGKPYPVGMGKDI
jgi:hypothetical protein